MDTKRRETASKEPNGVNTQRTTANGLRGATTARQSEHQEAGGLSFLCLDVMKPRFRCETLRAQGTPPGPRVPWQHDRLSWDRNPPSKGLKRQQKKETPTSRQRCHLVRCHHTHIYAQCILGFSSLHTCSSKDPPLAGAKCSAWAISRLHLRRKP